MNNLAIAIICTLYFLLTCIVTGGIDFLGFAIVLFIGFWELRYFHNKSGLTAINFAMKNALSIVVLAALIVMVEVVFPEDAFPKIRLLYPVVIVTGLAWFVLGEMAMNKVAKSIRKLFIKQD